MLKKCLLGLFVGFVGLIGFGSCEFINLSTSSDNFVVGNYVNLATSSRNYEVLTNGDVVCVLGNTQNSFGIYSNSEPATSDSVFLGELAQGNVYCSSENYWIRNNSTNNMTIYFVSPISSSYCEEEYNLIPISSVDTNYCVQNDLCPVSTGNCNNWSELMINNIVHEGKPLINISIPDNIYWDYATNDNQFDLYVGSGYNQDYIDSVLAINSYRPDNQDFTNIFVSGLTLIFPYIFVALLIVFIWKLLKRIFK